MEQTPLAKLCALPDERPSRPQPSRVSTRSADDVPLGNAYRSGELISDKYRLLRLLGEGGMGVVWLARNLALDSDVAIKLLRAGEKTDALERRMLKEAQAVARLGHPAILRVFDFGTTRRNDPYMVMEVLDGEDLAQTLDRNGRLSATKAVRTLLPILHALGTAHQKGIVHRDLKPENIFLTTTDGGYVQPKVVDFGIVKTDAPELDRLTRMGTVLGTPAYLSPQQARGEDVDQRTDIWSAAVVLYEMMTCRLPFEGGNYNSLMRSIIEDIPAPITNFGTGDAQLWAILERALAKRVTERWPTMYEFGRALAEWLLARGESSDISGASLRAAWQQGPTAARVEDLYSGHPDSTPRPRLLNSADPGAETLLLHGGAGARPATARALRHWLLAGAGLVLLAAGFGVVWQRSSAAKPTGQALATPAPATTPPHDRLAQRASAPTPQARPAASSEAAAAEPAHAHAPAGVQPAAPDATAPARRSAPSPRRARSAARGSAPAAGEDLKTTL
ncbi:MAG TPA: serine/threonine-protein kinase [Polyangiaceae bacterium]|nr:serine/threonine-protein kinase [Polyangiaceae bacterium]